MHFAPSGLTDSDFSITLSPLLLFIHSRTLGLAHVAPCLAYRVYNEKLC